MAWLALATQRLDRLAEDTRKHTGRERNAKVLQSLTLQFDSASTDDLGGGTFWSTKRDFKNTPATAPVALYYARTGNRAKAQALLDWLDARLYEPGQGLYRDGLRISGTGEVALVDTIYTYNQGPVLGALLELGGDANLGRAAALVDAVARSLTNRPRCWAAPLPCCAAKERATAGSSPESWSGTSPWPPSTNGCPSETRATAATLVNDTAEALWEGRRILPPQDRLARQGSHLIFSDSTALPARRRYPEGAAVELSTQLQAWMVLEAAASIAPAARHQARLTIKSRNSFVIDVILIT